MMANIKAEQRPGDHDPRGILGTTRNPHCKEPWWPLGKPSQKAANISFHKKFCTHVAFLQAEEGCIMMVASSPNPASAQRHQQDQQR